MQDILIIRFVWWEWERFTLSRVLDQGAPHCMKPWSDSSVPYSLYLFKYTSIGIKITYVSLARWFHTLHKLCCSSTQFHFNLCITKPHIIHPICSFFGFFKRIKMNISTNNETKLVETVCNWSSYAWVFFVFWADTIIIFLTGTTLSNSLCSWS